MYPVEFCFLMGPTPRWGLGPGDGSGRVPPLKTFPLIREGLYYKLYFDTYHEKSKKENMWKIQTMQRRKG